MAYIQHSEDVHTLVDSSGSAVVSVWSPRDSSIADTGTAFSDSKTITSEKGIGTTRNQRKGNPGILGSVCLLLRRAFRNIVAGPSDLLGQSYEDKGQLRYRQDGRPTAVAFMSGRRVQKRVRRLRKQFRTEHVDGPARCNAYMELVDLVCTLLSAPVGSYDDILTEMVWEVFTGELQRGHSQHLVTALSYHPGEVVAIVLRHLALLRKADWSLITSPDDFSGKSLQNHPRSFAFSSTHVVALELAFFEVLSGVLRCRPEAVHEAFDDRAHLVWFKLISPNYITASANLSSIFESLSFTYRTYCEHFDPSTSPEIESFILFLVTSTTVTERTAASASWSGEGLTSVLNYVRATLSTIASAPFPRIPEDPNTTDLSLVAPAWNIFRLALDCPGLFSPHLAHPCLPIILFAAELAQHSSHAVTSLVSDAYPEGSPKSLRFMDALHILWRYYFPLPNAQPLPKHLHGYVSPPYNDPQSHPGPSRVIRREHREHAMSLAVCLLLANMAASAHEADNTGDPAAMNSLARCMLSSLDMEAWLWDVACESLFHQIGCFKRSQASDRVCKTTEEKPSSDEKECSKIYVDRLPLVLHILRRTIEIKEAPSFPPVSQPQVDDSKMDRFILAILASATQVPSWTTWLIALDTLGEGRVGDVSHYLRGIRTFASVLLHTDSVLPAPRCTICFHLHSDQADVKCLTSSGKDSSGSGGFSPINIDNAPPTFAISTATDRFVAIILSVARRNSALGEAITAHSEVKVALMKVAAADEVGMLWAGDRPSEVDAKSGEARQEEWRAKLRRDLSRFLRC